MKNMKKLASLLLALVMALALAVPAFATDEGVPNTNAPDTSSTTSSTSDLTLPKEPAGRDYEIYQIFTGTSRDGQNLGNAAWGQNGKGGDLQAALDALADVQETAENKDKLIVIEQYVNLSNPYKTGKAGEKLTVDTGYYLIKDVTKATENPKEDEAGLSLYLVAVVGPTTLEAKVGTTTVEKKIVDRDGEKVDVNSASIGEVVNYEITGTVPENITDYKFFYYEFVDTLSKGLTLDENSIKVTVDGADVTASFVANKSVTKDEETGETTISLWVADLKTVATLTKGSEVVLTYNATVNEDAVINGTGNPNDVKLVYGRDPNFDWDGKTEPGEKPKVPTGETPKDEVKTFVTQILIKKIDGNTQKALDGAGFTLSGEFVKTVKLEKGAKYEEAADGTYWKLTDGTYTETDPNTDGMDKTKYESTTIKYKKVTVLTAVESDAETNDVFGMVDENGELQFVGLSKGDYTLTETVVPVGYNNIDPITFTIEFTAKENELDGEFSISNATVDEGTGIFTFTVENNQGATLPSTGGIGTTIFYVVGGVMAVGAVILLITKRRMSIEK